MKTTVSLSGQAYEFDLNNAIDISIAIQREESVGSFDIPGANYTDYIDGSFIGNKNRGGPCNLETILFTPHGNGTHTECYGHIALEKVFVNDCVSDYYLSARLYSLPTRKCQEDEVLDFSGLNPGNFQGIQALILRTLPNTNSKLSRNYSGTNSPYILEADMKMIVDAGIEHLVLDLPSVDKEWDGGKLAAHHLFWQYPYATRSAASITEFAFIPDEVKDGLYMLKLNISGFVSDAAPSKPQLFTLNPQY